METFLLRSKRCIDSNERAPALDDEPIFPPSLQPASDVVALPSPAPCEFGRRQVGAPARLGAQPRQRGGFVEWPQGRHVGGQFVGHRRLLQRQNLSNRLAASSV